MLRVVTLFLVLAVAACDGPERPDRDLPEPRAGASARALELRERLLALASAQPSSTAPVRPQPPVARSSPPQRLAFAKARFARLTDDSLVVVNAKTGAKVVTFPVAGPRRVVGGVDGSLVVVGSDHVYHLGPRSDEPERHARIPSFADSVFYVHPSRPKRVLAVQLGKLIVEHDTSASSIAILPIVETHEVDGLDGRAITMLRDGAFLATTGTGLIKFYLGGAKRTVAMTDRRAPWRLAPARQLDHAWIAYDDGAIQLVKLQDDAREVAAARAGRPPFDLAAGGTLVAVTTHSGAGDAGAAWRVTAFDGGGRERWSAPFDGSAGGEVVVARDGSSVAVGGPGGARLFRGKDGRPVSP